MGILQHLIYSAFSATATALATARPMFNAAKVYEHVVSQARRSLPLVDGTMDIPLGLLSSDLKRPVLSTY